MGGNAGERGDGVRVAMEISGDYDEVVAKLATDSTEGPDLDELLADVRAILETIERIDGGTRSAIARNLPAEMTADYDAEAVVMVLQVLEGYGIVTLEGNTWYPGRRID